MVGSGNSRSGGRQGLPVNNGSYSWYPPLCSLAVYRAIINNYIWETWQSICFPVEDLPMKMFIFANFPKDESVYRTCAFESCVCPSIKWVWYDLSITAIFLCSWQSLWMTYWLCQYFEQSNNNTLLLSCCCWQYNSTMNSKHSHWSYHC